jgi:hypothetical protein
MVATTKPRTLADLKAKDSDFQDFERRGIYKLLSRPEFAKEYPPQDWGKLHPNDLCAFSLNYLLGLRKPPAISAAVEKLMEMHPDALQRMLLKTRDAIEYVG